ncbi:MAG: prolyl oligopeptidase family serine peptidase, partial [Armatimonadetes bacterium]|nr:prolyl oligopeptidase family serine peptidase [Armatimonadota bacterium]
FGFDWEDWGRLDALEVREEAMRVFGTDPSEVYLTGHSMGGHGAWYLGATDPDKWAAIGPAAGWISFWTYGGAVTYPDPDPIEKILLRVSNPSDITKIIRNYKHMGVFVLQGAEDRTVPIEQPRKMREYLAEFHRDVDFYEHPGGGHWYDSSDEPGTDCVDYGPMFDFFDRRRRRLSHEVRTVEFHTVHPGVSATSHWMTVVAQERPFVTSSVVATNPIGTDRFEVETVNVSRFEIDVAGSPVGSAQTVTVVVDGTEVEASVDDGIVRFDNVWGWIAVGEFHRGDKNPQRAGPFKGAFDNRFVLVYGTTGTPEENAWSFAKARFDAETWQYRGNGHAEVLPDTILMAGGLGGFNIIAYGNEDTNYAIKRFLQDSPVRIGRESIVVGSKRLVGDDLSILMIRPINDYSNLSIAVVGGTGIKGMRSTDTLPYFVSGIHYPDVFVFDSRLHEIGSKAVRVAGVFGTDWSVANGDFAWRD